MKELVNPLLSANTFSLELNSHYREPKKDETDISKLFKHCQWHRIEHSFPVPYGEQLQYNGIALMVCCSSNMLQSCALTHRNLLRFTDKYDFRHHHLVYLET